MKTSPLNHSPKTDEFIQFLAKDAAARSPNRREIYARGICYAAYARFWLIGAAIVLILCYWLLPRREDLSIVLGRFDTLVLFTLWSFATLLPAIKVYGLAFPGAQLSAPFRRLANLAPLPFVLLLVWTIARFRFDDFGFQLYRESSYLNGGCGMVIAVAGALHASFLFTWIRRGATTSPAKAGAWAAVSTASFASFVIQFACANENPIHVLLWHFIPLMMLTGLASVYAKRLFRW